jgi:predicted amidohydrolase YtcJ
MLQRVHRSQTNPNLSEELIHIMLRPLSALSASSCSALLALSAAPWGLPAHSATPQQAANTVLVNGSVYTVNPRQPWAQAVAVRGDQIVYVGSNQGARAFLGKGSRTIDLQGKLLLPGFVESHIHVLMGAATTSGVTLTMTDTLVDIQRKLKAYAEANPSKPAIFGSAYNGLLFGEAGPKREWLDAVVPDRPVILADHTLHTMWANSKALEVAGITKATPNPPGGEYVRDSAGNPTGTIKGSPASVPVIRATGVITAADIERSLPKILAGLSEYGFTAAMDFGNPIATKQAAAALVKLDQQGKVPLRLSLMHLVNTADLARTAVADSTQLASQARSPHVWVDTLKIIGDSVLENQKAALEQPYLKDGKTPTTNFGALYFEKPTLLAMMQGVAKAGQGTAIHAIGDRTVRTALDAAQAFRQAGDSKTRLIITHAQLVDPAQIKRFAANNVIVQTTGVWINLQPSYVSLLGQRRNDTLQFPLRSLIDSGAVVALGADWPATAGGFEHGVNPFNNIYTAMHRRPPQKLIAEFGSVNQVLPPAREVLTLAEAIQAYTLNGARQMGKEKEFGSIEVGKKADLILLSQNLFAIQPEAIPATKVLATMAGGRLVHDVAYGIGDADLTNLNALDQGAVGLCPHDHGEASRHPHGH